MFKRIHRYPVGSLQLRFGQPLMLFVIHVLHCWDIQRGNVVYYHMDKKKTASLTTIFKGKKSQIISILSNLEQLAALLRAREGGRQPETGRWRQGQSCGDTAASSLPVKQSVTQSASADRQTDRQTDRQAMAVSQRCCCRVVQCHTLSLSLSVLVLQRSLSLSSPPLHPLVPSSHSSRLPFPRQSPSLLRI